MTRLALYALGVLGVLAFVVTEVVCGRWDSEAVDIDRAWRAWRRP